MPEGPSIVILREALLPFKGKKITAAAGYADIDFNRLAGKTIKDLKSWGKHFLICFNDFFVRIHLMMFGTYRINSHRPGNPALHLEWKDGEVNFYTCQVKLVEQKAEDVYDWEADIMSEHWNAEKAEAAVRQLPEAKLCDVLLNQELFAGVGNIIKNEALFKARIHPLSQVKSLPLKKLRELVAKTRSYSLDFYTQKKEGTLSRNWEVYEKKICPRNHVPIEKEYLGKNKRLSFFCSQCQILYKN